MHQTAFQLRPTEARPASLSFLAGAHIATLLNISIEVKGTAEVTIEHTPSGGCPETDAVTLHEHDYDDADEDELVLIGRNDFPDQQYPHVYQGDQLSISATGTAKINVVFTFQT
jgi:hypothetical protein